MKKFQTAKGASQGVEPDVPGGKSVIRDKGPWGEWGEITQRLSNTSGVETGLGAVESLGQLQSKEVTRWKYLRNVICLLSDSRLEQRDAESKGALCL